VYTLQRPASGITRGMRSVYAHASVEGDWVLFNYWGVALGSSAFGTTESSCSKSVVLPPMRSSIYVRKYAATRLSRVYTVYAVLYN
jgi:hypothetical protein